MRRGRWKDKELPAGVRIAIPGKGVGRYESFNWSVFEHNTHYITFDEGGTQEVEIHMYTQWSVSDDGVLTAE